MFSKKATSWSLVCVWAICVSVGCGDAQEFENPQDTTFSVLPPFPNSEQSTGGRTAQPSDDQEVGGSETSGMVAQGGQKPVKPVVAGQAGMAGQGGAPTVVEVPGGNGPVAGTGGQETAGAAGETSVIPDCSANQQICVGLVPFTCSAGAWMASDTCQYSCQAGVCTGECVPGTQECSGNGTRTCGTDATWSDIVTCPAGPNQDWTCTGSGVCGVTCQASWGDVDGEPGNGCEHDIYNDPENCGQPGRSCFGGTCTLGECEFQIEKVATLPNIGEGGGMMDMELDGDFLYVHFGDSSIRRIRKDGSEPSVTLATNQLAMAQNNLIVDGGYVYWVSKTVGDSGIRRVSVEGGSVQVVASQTPWRFDVEDGTVYWNDGVIETTEMCVNCGYTTFWKVSAMGGTPEELGSLPDRSYAQVHVQGGMLYMIRTAGYDQNNELAFQVFVVDIDDWSSVTVLGGYLSQSLGDWTFTSQYMFLPGWSEAGAVVRRFSLDGSQGNVDTSPGASIDPRYQIAANDQYVYHRGSTRIERAPINGGVGTAISPAHEPEFVNLDDQYVYWTTWSLTPQDTNTYVFRTLK